MTTKTTNTSDDLAMLREAMGSLFHITAELALVEAKDPEQRVQVEQAQRIAANRALKIRDYLLAKDRGF